MFLGLVVGRQPGTFPPLGKSGGVRADGPRWTLVDLVDLKDLVAFTGGTEVRPPRGTEDGAGADATWVDKVHQVH